MNKENCALKLIDEIILFYDARSKKHQHCNFRFCNHQVHRDFLITLYLDLNFFPLFVPSILRTYAVHFLLIGTVHISMYGFMTQKFKQGYNHLLFTFANFHRRKFRRAGPSGSAAYSVGLRTLAWWECGFESRRGLDVCLK